MQVVQGLGRIPDLDANQHGALGNEDTAYEFQPFLQIWRSLGKPVSDVAIRLPSTDEPRFDSILIEVITNKRKYVGVFQTCPNHAFAHETLQQRSVKSAAMRKVYVAYLLCPSYGNSGTESKSLDCHLALRRSGLISIDTRAQLRSVDIAKASGSDFLDEFDPCGGY